MCETIGTQAFTNNLAFFLSISVFFLFFLEFRILLR